MKIKPILPYLTILIIIILLFYPLFTGQVPIPLDSLVGAYHPWFDYKWGYPTGVPFKNITVTDVFSQLYPWRITAMDTIRQGQWPLWNPYSFSGMPLLANWQSAPFYPFNFLLLLFGNLWGWALLIVLQPLLALIFMYQYLRHLKLPQVSSLLGAIIFALSGFMMTYLEYGTTGHILLWIPLQLLLIEKYIQSNNRALFLQLYALTFFPILTGGFFQPAFYALSITLSYALIRIWQTTANKISALLKLSLFTGLGISTAALQLLPTFELLQHSIRNFDHNIQEYAYGLLPLRNAITLLAPDFYGNPATHNFWGFLQYQETAGYFGIISVVLVILALTKIRSTTYHWYFSGLFLGSLLLAFDNPLSQLIYQLHIPGLSTGYASRILMVTCFSAAVLAALGTQQLLSKRTRLISTTLTIIITSLVAYLFYQYRQAQPPYPSLLSNFFLIENSTNLHIAFRNLVIPTGLIGLFTLSTFIFKSKRILLSLALLLICFDLFRFFHKYTPFSPTRLANLSVPVIEYLQQHTDHARIETEYGPVMPANSWMYARLSSPSGYDPLVVKSYAQWYRIYQSGGADQHYQAGDLATGNFTRYLNQTNYQSPYLDLAGVKYLIGVTRDEQGKIDPHSQNINQNIPLDKFKAVFQDGATVVFENQSVMPRVNLFDQFQVEPDQLTAQEKLFTGLNFQQQIIIDQPPTLSQHQSSLTDTAEITADTPNQVTIQTHTSHPTFLMLTDTAYPGWTVSIDQQPTTLLTANGTFRAVELPAGNHTVNFKYRPRAFFSGLKISLTSLTLLILLLIINQQKSRSSKRKASPATKPHKSKHLKPKS